MMRRLVPAFALLLLLLLLLAGCASPARRPAYVQPPPPVEVAPRVETPAPAEIVIIHKRPEAR